MKILGISILRLGDIFIHMPALQTLKKNHPEAEIHILINSQFRNAMELIPGIDQIHEFDRSTIQKAMTDKRLPITNAFSMVKGLVGELNEEGFDLVVNLTHNRLSALIAGRVNSLKYEGLVFEDKEYKHLGSKWWRELSHHSRAESHFTFTQILDLAVGGTGEASLTLKAPEPARFEARRFSRQAEFRVCVQAQTSDAKKSFNLSQTQKLIERMDQSLESSEFLFLCAPNEVETLQPLVTALALEEISVQLAPVSLGGAMVLIEESDLLLTSDTSIKHIARATSTPVVEICLGSSAPRETGSVRPGDYVVQSRELCVPCKHSEACFREKRFCADRINPEMIAELCVSVLKQDKNRIAILAERGRRDFRIFTSLNQVSGIHFFELEKECPQVLKRLWDSEIWATCNNVELPPEDSVVTDGTTEQLMKELSIQGPIAMILARGILEETEVLEQEVRRCKANLLDLGLSLKSAAPGSLSSAELESFLSSLLGLTDSSGFLRLFRIHLSRLTEVNAQSLSELTGLLAETEMMCRLRSLQLSNFNLEKGVAHVQC